MISRIIRALVGLGLVGYAIYSGNIWFYLGVIPLFTAIINWCPIESKVGGCDPESACCTKGECETQTPYVSKKESLVTGISKQETPIVKVNSFSVAQPIKIEILGTGCSKCVALEKIVNDVIETMDGNYEVIKVDNIEDIMAYNVMSTPGLVINGEVKSNGKLLSQEEVHALLEKQI